MIVLEKKREKREKEKKKKHHHSRRRTEEQKGNHPMGLGPNDIQDPKTLKIGVIHVGVNLSS